jgi:hypothetical protein
MNATSNFIISTAPLPLFQVLILAFKNFNRKSIHEANVFFLSNYLIGYYRTNCYDVRRQTPSKKNMS